MNLHGRDHLGQERTQSQSLRRQTSNTQSPLADKPSECRFLLIPTLESLERPEPTSTLRVSVFSSSLTMLLFERLLRKRPSVLDFGLVCTIFRLPFISFGSAAYPMKSWVFIVLRIWAGIFWAGGHFGREGKNEGVQLERRSVS